MFEPGELLARLVALVPAPRGHLGSDHGVLAPGARWRARVVRDRTANETAPARGLGPASAPCPTIPDPDASIGELRERRLTWTELMERVFALDILECPRCRDRRQLIIFELDPLRCPCGATMVLVAVITDPDVIDRILRRLRARSALAATGRPPPA